MLRELPNVPTQTVLRLDNQLKAGYGRVMMMMMTMMAGKKKSYGAKLRNWPVANLRLALCSLGTLYTRHSHSPAGTLHIMHRPATLYMGCSQGTLYTQCSPDTICPVAFKIYLEHNNDDNLNFVGMALDACLSGSKELHEAKKIGLIVASMFCVCMLLK